MPVRHRWPVACQLRLVELCEEVPPLTNREMGIIISEMPEAKAFGLIATKDAVGGKVWRMRKWSPEVAAKLLRS